MDDAMRGLSGRLVALIGGGGFLGRYTAQALLRAGARLRIVQRDPRAAFFLRTQGPLGQTQFAAADVTNPDAVARAIAGADAVVNLAGTFGARMASVQADGAGIVARAAADAGVAALVHVSAIGADGASPAVYGRSKAAGEAKVRDAFPGATILRPSILFGREDAFVNRFAGMIAAAPVVPVLRAPTRFQPVFVADVADAIAHAAAAPGTFGGRMFELGGPNIITMGELIRWIARAIGRDPVIVDLPDAIGALIAAAGVLPGAPITPDQWKMLQSDNVVAADADGIAAFGIAPTPLSLVAPTWLVRFRRHGRFGRVRAV